MLDLDHFSRIVSGIYDASMDFERWADPLSLLSKVFNTKGGQFVIGSPPATVDYIKVWGWTDEQLATFMPKFVSLTPYDPRGRMGDRPFKAVHCRQYVTDEQLWASEMYKQALVPAGAEYIMTFLVPFGDNRFCVVGMIRDK